MRLPVGRIGVAVALAGCADIPGLTPISDVDYVPGGPAHVVASEERPDLVEAKTVVPPAEGWAETCNIVVDDEPPVVTLRFDIDRRGRPQDITVVESPSECLAGYAIAAMEQWAFKRPRIDAEPTQVNGVKQDIIFRPHAADGQ